MPRALWKWTRRIAIVLGIVIVALLVLAVVADRWIMPRLLERQIVASLSKHWDGRVTMQAVRFSFFGPTEIDSLRLEDNQGRPWVHIGRARANLRDWPGFSPVLDELDLDDVVVQVRVADDFPLIQPKEESDPSPYIDLQRIRAHRLALILHHNDELLDLGRLTLAVDIQDDNYRFNIAPLPGSDGRLRASGDIGGEPAQIRAQIRFDRQVGRDDMAFLQSFVRGNLPIRRAEGWLTAQADVRGAMAQWTQLDISATARMESWNFLIADDLPVTDLQADLQFQNWQLHASQVRLMVLGNPVTARGTVDMSADQVTYRGSARADKVDLQKLAAAFDLPQLTGGQAAFNVIAAGPVNGHLEFSGNADIQALLSAGPLRTAGGPLAFAGSWPVEQTAPGHGRVHLDLRNWQAAGRDATLFQRLMAQIEFDGNHLTMSRATADALGGKLIMSGRVALQQSDEAEPMTFGGRIRAQGLRVERLSQLLDIDTQATGLADVDAQWSIRSGDTWLVSAVGGGVMLLSDAGDDHKILGHFSMESDPAAEDFAMTLRLRDWDWWRNNLLLAALSEAVVHVTPDHLAADQVIVLTPGGNVQARGELWRGQEQLPWRYQGAFEMNNFDPLIFAPTADGFASTGTGNWPLVLLTMRGQFRGLGDDFFEAMADGVISGLWPEPIAARATSSITVDLNLAALDEPDLLNRMQLLIRLDDGLVDHRGEVVFDRLWAEARVRPGNASPPGPAGPTGFPGDIQALFTASGIGGELHGQAGTRIKDASTHFWSDITLSQINLARLPLVTAAPDWLRGTRLNTRIWVETQEGDILATRGSGSILAGLNFEELSEVSGDFNFDLKIHDITADDGPRVLGSADFSNGQLKNPVSLLVDNLRMSAISFGRSTDVSSIRGTILGGRSHGMFRFDFPPDKPSSFRGGIDISRLNLNTAAVAFGHTGDKVAGNADLRYRFTGNQFLPEAITGTGALLVRESEMSGVPVLQAILAALVLAPQSASDTDLDLSFSNNGPIATILSGRAATPVVAIRPLPGGTVNLETGELNFSVVAALLSDLEQLTDIPILDLLVPLVSRLTQVDVTGTWHDRDTIQTRVNAVTGVGEATANFFKGVGRTGGDLGEAFFSPLREVGP